jgi:hypothetical protein
MIPVAIDPNAELDDSRIIAEIRKLFANYGPTFVQLADGIGGEIGRLRHAHFGGSTLDKCDIRVLNPKAALVDALWLRRDEGGNLMERFGVIYLVALTSAGWRITSAVSIAA